jgi:hypothetical protein
MERVESFGFRPDESEIDALKRLGEQPYRVTLVVDRNYSFRLLGLALDEPLWVIDSAVNRIVVEKMRAASEGQGDKRVITSFKDCKEMSEEAIAQGMLDTVYEHHGPAAGNRSLTVIRVIGSKQTADITNWFSKEGFKLMTDQEHDFEAHFINR